MLTANDVPAIRRTTLEWLANSGPSFYELMIELGKQPIRPSGPNRYVAEILASAEAFRIRNADLWFFEPDLCELLSASHQSMPSFIPTPMDLPSQTGFAMFANPMTVRPGVSPDALNNAVLSRLAGNMDHSQEMIIYNLVTDVVKASGEDVDVALDNLSTAIINARPGCQRADLVRELRAAYEVDRITPETITSEQVEIYGVSWSPMAPMPMGRGEGAGSAGGTWFSFYSRTRFDLIDPALVQKTRMVMPEYLVDNEAVVPWQPPGADPTSYALPSTGATTWGWARLVFAAFRLAAQTGLVEQETMRTPRAERRRTERQGLPERDVRVARIRRTTASGDPGTSAGREYLHRWVVRGHWRNQWYRSVEAHRPIWISPHVKGPDDAPLIGGERVTTIGVPRVE